MFQIVEIEKCEVCNTLKVKGYKEGVTDNIGIGVSHRTREFCLECFDKNTFTNSNGFTFLRLKNNLYCYKPYQYLDFGFRPVRSEREIDRAFNPEKYEFEMWLSRYES
ncbi:hypothetical protein HUB98_06145 [Paenibacillus barcinonensis]|uniref:Uncharacterized protein n=1 Tax=Paenibacillus barcinonensis TaxID=198119 RepID=A0A2V4VEU2_PAEBA|nr:hypothetical protein [Paenibacillus barcinonensis]PYE51594.1 hypothetical protein DFQ00_102389 [Paenibacillus barcinonensis]QKS55961.1 hypothetical protein HUB98_06145 [Paenibacillus barcinonensis]